VKPLEPLPIHLPLPGERPSPSGDGAPGPHSPASARSPAADRGTSPPAASGRQPAGAPSAPAPRAPLEASFRFEEQARQVVVTLIRPETQQVVLQVPPEKILKLIAYLRQFITTTFDRQA
jgi:hypothetical protein